MDATLNARWSLSSVPRPVLLAFALASLASAPVSWLMDGVTPSFIVYPLVLVFGLWRLRRGRGTLFLGIAATIFLLIHLPFSWAAITSSGENPSNASAPYNPDEWLISMLILPFLTAVAGLIAWRQADSK